MPQFHFRLEKVQQVRRSMRETRRLELLEAQQVEDQVAAQIADLRMELQSLRWHQRSAAGTGPLNLEGLQQSQRYESSLRGELESAQRRRETLSSEVQRRRHVLVEADREVKVLDRLKDKQQMQFRQDEARHETKQQDDQLIVVAALRCAS
jgi:flagellar protein FliJ